MRRIIGYAALVPVVLLFAGCEGGAYMTLAAKDPVGAAIADVNGDSTPTSWC